jgi:hypothetical protein
MIQFLTSNTYSVRIYPLGETRFPSFLGKWAKAKHTLGHQLGKEIRFRENPDRLVHVKSSFNPSPRFPDALRMRSRC